MCENSSENEDLDSQFILRLPMEDAQQLKEYFQSKPKKITKNLKICFDPEARLAEVIIHKKSIPMELVDLPTIIESLKTTNGNVLFKTADICQMLVPSVPEENNNKKDEKKHLWKHGLTPPLKNIRKQRFRRVLKNDQILDSGDIEKELRWLFKSDNEAVAVRWELVDDPDYKKDEKSDAYYQEERDVFGDILTDSSETDTAEEC